MELRVKVWALGASLLLGCESCPREGCAALESRVPDSGKVSRVAGVVASESDVVGNGCQECGFASAELSAWPSQGQVETEEQVRAQTLGTPRATASAGNDGAYVMPLEPGDYLICTNISCFNAGVVEGHTTTLNIKLINGVSSGFLGLPGTSGLRRSNALFKSP